MNCKLKSLTLYHSNKQTKQTTMKRLILLPLLLLQLCAYADEAQALRDSILSVISGAPSLANASDASGTQRHAVSNQRKASITAFGAKGDGKTDCKPAFDKAIRKARSYKQGLHIVVPAGKWFVKGPIHLASNVTLELQRGATLLFSPTPEDYLPAVPTSWEGAFCYNYSPFIYGYQLHNVAIIGEGTIDGNCMDTFPKWRAKQKADQQQLRRQDHEETPYDLRRYGEGNYLRPHLVQLYDCKDITLSGIFITNSPFWCIHLLCCENVICRGLRYDAKLVNNDGIDPEMTRNLLIEDIDFNNGDDNVAIKAGRDNDGWRTARPSENIIIRNCRFKGLHGVVIGSEMSAGVRNVFVEDCDYAGYVKRGLYIKTNPNRGGFVNNIFFNRCKFGKVEDLFYITSMYAGEGADDNHFTDVHDIHVTDVTCEEASSAAIVLQGTEAKPLHDISFRNVNVGKASTGFSSMNTLDIILQNCNIGGTATGAPSQAK